MTVNEPGIYCMSVATIIILQINETMMHKHMNKEGLLYHIYYFISYDKISFCVRLAYSKRIF
jgi:hypothetical protein